MSPLHFRSISSGSGTQIFYWDVLGESSYTTVLKYLSTSKSLKVNVQKCCSSLGTCGKITYRNKNKVLIIIIIRIALIRMNIGYISELHY